MTARCRCLRRLRRSSRRRPRTVRTACHGSWITPHFIYAIERDVAQRTHSLAASLRALSCRYLAALRSHSQAPKLVVRNP